LNYIYVGMTRSNLFEETVGDVLSVGIEGAGDGVFVVNPSRSAIRGLVSVLAGNEALPKVRLFVAEQRLKALLDDFLVASSVADLVESGILAVRTLPDVPNNAMVITEESVATLVEGPEGAGALTATEESFVSSVRDHYERRWEAAPSLSLRTPARSRVMETLRTEIGSEAAGDFEAILDTLDTARGDGGDLDEVTISLLVAARNGELLYDISKWGEDIDLASKATFSRTKTRLEEAGLLDTEKVPIDVGRPRLRLMLGDSRLEETDIETFVSVAEDLST
jgi:hypothetical protein